MVALLAILVGAAYPTAYYLFDRFREDALRENLISLRTAIEEFPHNRFDDDRDGRTDEDPRGDRNLDGFPGIRGVDDDGDLLVDEDWGGRLPFKVDGIPNLDYDYRSRADDDEDGTVDEEAFPGDLNELAAKMEILRNEVPVDPTTNQSAWGIIGLEINNDFDYTDDSFGPFIPGQSPVIRSRGPVFLTTSSVILFEGNPPSSMSESQPLTILIDEDPRNGLDDDFDGLIDEDPQDIVDVRSLNDQPSVGMTPYSSW